MNLQKIDDLMATAGIGEGTNKTLTEHVDKAKAAVAAGDFKEAVAITSKVLEHLEKTEKGSGSAGGSGA
ncbi:hypothetical protein [Kitasatospora purpeofusca]|uniref:hypothetical protein n=1 Tax=Kitasatospora purpeofusca TaxID=67352 RepID=UPI002A5AA40B|nr:hypothetical protein [Kitasatospora purpeofusca]MDY0816073.1 hypothetical protein [Kitasatospora purpeofusca]